MLLVVAGLLLVVYLLLDHKYKFWARKGVSFARPTLLVGSLTDFLLRRKNVGIVHDEIYRKFQYQDAVGFFDFLTPRLMVKNPAIIHKVLSKDFESFHDTALSAPPHLNPYIEQVPFLAKGEGWKVARKNLSNGLAKAKKELLDLMIPTVKKLDVFLDNKLGKNVDVQEVACIFTMDSMARSVYGIESYCFTNPRAQFRKKVERLTKDYWLKWKKVLIVFFIPSIRNILRLSFIPPDVVEFVKNVVKNALGTTKSVPTKLTVLHYLSDSYEEIPDEATIKDSISHALTFIMAGMETSSIPASNTLYELAMNPDIQERLHAELSEAFGSAPDFSSYDDRTLATLPYLDKVIKETLRKYPVFYAYSRVCTKATFFIIDGKTVPIELGTHVMVPIYSIHRDPAYFEDPETFNPERFSEKNEREIAKHTYIPFGEGPRTCPGNVFGLVQLRLFLANVILKYKVHPTEKTPAKLELSTSSFFVKQETELWLSFERRIKT